MPQLNLTGSDLVAIISVISTIIITIHANLSGKRFDVDKLKYEEKRSAYLQFCQSISEFMYPKDIQDRDFEAISNAYFKVALYAPQTVAEAAKRHLDASKNYAFAMTALENNQQKIETFRKTAEHHALAVEISESQNAMMEAFKRDLASTKNFR